MHVYIHVYVYRCTRAFFVTLTLAARLLTAGLIWQAASRASSVSSRNALSREAPVWRTMKRFGRAVLASLQAPVHIRLYQAGFRSCVLATGSLGLFAGEG